MNTKRKSKRITCYGCDKVDHVKAKCKARKNQNLKNDQKNSGSATKAFDEKHDMMHAFKNEEASACDNKQTHHGHIKNTSSTAQRQYNTNKICVGFRCDATYGK